MEDSDIVNKINEAISRIGNLEGLVSSLCFDKSYSWSDDAIEEPGGGFVERDEEYDDAPFSLSYSEDGITVDNCFFRVSRSLCVIDSVLIGKNPSGLCVLHIDHSSPGSSTVKITESCENTDQASEIPLYRFKEGVVERDYRSVPVLQLYE